MDDGGLLYGMNDEYRIKVFDENGNLERIIAKPFDPEPVGEADREIVRAATLDFWSAGGIPEYLLEQLAENVRFAETFPAYHRFLTGPQRSTWVQRVARPTELSEEELRYFSAALANVEALLTDPHLAMGSREWDVFDADGRLLGVVTMPQRFRPLKFTDDAVYGVWRDEVGVDYVVRLRVVGL